MFAIIADRISASKKFGIEKQILCDSKNESLTHINSSFFLKALSHKDVENTEGRSCGSCPRGLVTIYCVDRLCYQPHEPFQIVLTICTVDFDTPNFFAAARTVV